jgi:hypothetical protein
MTDKFNPQSKAVLAEVPGRAFIIRTADKRTVVLTPELAMSLAREILNRSALIIAEPAPARGGFVQ